jgi:hypothetical protein
MATNKIIVWTNPTAPFQKIYVMKDGVLVDQMGIMPNNIVDIVFALVDKYNISSIDFSGAHSFAENFANELKKDQIARYGHEHLTINFI